MNRYEVKKAKQMELLEGGVEVKNQSAKRVNIVSLKMVRESSLLYKNRQIKSPNDANKVVQAVFGES